MLRQERLLWRLQELKQEEVALTQTEELKAIMGRLKDFRGKVQTGEQELQSLLEMIEKMENEVAELEKKSSYWAEQVKISKDKLYETKGSSLKELLSLQQSVLKLESQGKEAENKYWELLKKIEECRQKKDEYKETIKVLQIEFDEGVTQYQKMKAEIELKFAEIKSKQEEVQEQLFPEVVKLFQEAERHYPASFVAKLHKNTCLGCHIGLSLASVKRVKEGKVLQHCDNCGRILIDFF